MKVIYNNIIPFKGYLAINLFGFVFARKEYKGKIRECDLNHEAIHTAQMKECAYIPFYIIYFIEWLIKIFKYKDSHKAYRMISFEQEAYDNDDNLQYLKERNDFQWLTYY